MGEYRVKLIKKEEVARDTMAFLFKKPGGFTFKPGQHGVFTLIDPVETDEKGIDRVFSFASAPMEDHIMIATRIRDSAYKRALSSLPLGSDVLMEGPYGSMILQTDITRPAVFLTGGIGITPFLSMLRHIKLDDLKHRVYLFYSNKTPEEAVFLEELLDIDKERPNITVIVTMTRAEGSTTWEGRKGRIDRDVLGEFIDDFSEPIYYVAGPPSMVEAMKAILYDIGVIDDYIRSEEFEGY